MQQDNTLNNNKNTRQANRKKADIILQNIPKIAKPTIKFASTQAKLLAALSSNTPTKRNDIFYKILDNNKSIVGALKLDGTGKLKGNLLGQQIEILGKHEAELWVYDYKTHNSNAILSMPEEYTISEARGLDLNNKHLKQLTSQSNGLAI